MGVVGRVPAILRGADVPTGRTAEVPGTGDVIAQLPAIRLRGHLAALATSPVPARAARWDALAKAAVEFRSGTVAGLDPGRYAAVVAEATGLSHEVTATARETIAAALERVPDVLEAARPAGACWDWRDIAAGGHGAVWSRTGDVLAVVAPGNGPGPHALWPQAVGLGYRVLVRPSVREPYTPQRLVRTLADAGLADMVSFVPCAQAVVPDLVALADRTLLYGGEAVAAQHRGDHRVVVQGPGRSKVLVGRGADPQEALEVARRSVSDLSGRACVCASAVLVEGDHREFARSLAACVPGPVETADSAADPRVRHEWPGVHAVVAPFDAARDLGALSGSLVVTAVGCSDALVDRISRDGTIRNLHVGTVPTTAMDITVPHDGYLSESLMFCRGTFRSS